MLRAFHLESQSILDRPFSSACLCAIDQQECLKAVAMANKLLDALHSIVFNGHRMSSDYTEPS